MTKEQEKFDNAIKELRKNGNIESYICSAIVKNSNGNKRLICSICGEATNISYIYTELTNRFLGFDIDKTPNQ